MSLNGDKGTVSDSAQGPEPGSGHKLVSTEWIPLCRARLKDRELSLITKRQQKCIKVIALSVDQFTRQNTSYFIDLRGSTTVRVQRMDQVNREMTSHFLSNDFHRNTIASSSAALTATLKRWSGVQKSQKVQKQDVVEFGVYFKIAKNWLDQCKVDLLTEIYWIPLFAVIQQVWCIVRHSMLWVRVHSVFVGELFIVRNLE